MKNGPQNSIYSVFQVKKKKKKKNNGHQLFGIALWPFLGKVKNTANLRAVVAAINWFWCESIQQIGYAITGSL